MVGQLQGCLRFARHSTSARRSQPCPDPDTQLLLAVVKEDAEELERPIVAGDATLNQVPQTPPPGDVEADETDGDAAPENENLHRRRA